MRRFPVYVLVLMAMLAAACAPAPALRGDPQASFPLIPAPAFVERSPGFFLLRPGASLIVQADDAQALGVAGYFADLLQRTRGLHLDTRQRTSADSAANSGNAIVFVLNPQFLVRGDDRDEGYELSVSPQRIRLEARSPRGLFYGSITLWQLLTGSGGDAPLCVPALVIADYPRFAWRGLMLDSARSYQPPQFIEHLLDQMALHKLNVFHWHLTDDQGWRIQIKKYPELTKVGAWRMPASVSAKPPRYGGFYTQDEIRRIVRYAAARYITIVPEIEMPGHAQAAIAAYPQHGASPTRPPVSADWGVHTYLYNVDDATFDFLENVLTEVMDLFPGTYIHVGGDEAAKDQWQASAQVQRRMRELGVADETKLQSYFITRIERFLGAHGRKLIGWDEILQGGLPPQATVMSWQGTRGGIEAARQGHDVVMAPSPPMYLDHVQSDSHDEPPGRPDVVSLADVYAYEPLPQELDAAQAQHVLGAQANLWSEYMDTPQRTEHAAFPRVAALSEMLWSAPARRSWPDFLTRLPAQLDRYRLLGVEFADSAFAANISANYAAGRRGVNVEISNQTHFGEIHYTLDGTPPTPLSPAYRTPLELAVPATVTAAAFAQGRSLAAPRQRVLDALTLARANSDELLPCKPGEGLPLRLPGPALDGGQAVYRVDIFDPCWIYPRVDLDAVRRLGITVGALPYNFQLWKDAAKVVLRKPAQSGDELQVHVDTCNGERLAAIGLSGVATTSDGAAALELPLAQRHGVHDLCLEAARAAGDPLWAIDTVQLLP